jgi:PPOX class probable F420-dependent enzyme
MTTLQDLIDIAAQEGYLAVVSTVRADATIQSSVVNVGVVPHPLDGTEVIGFVTYGRAKLTNLRRRPQATVTVRSGWTWATAEGRTELFGPDDLHRDVGAERIRLLLRQVFVAAGGSHDDWETYDRTMAEQRRTVALLTPTRIYSN